MAQELNEYLLNLFKDIVKASDIEALRVARNSLVDMLVKVRD